MTDLIIPTCRDTEDPEIVNMVKEAQAASSLNLRVIVTGLQTSAATNRNYGLERAASGIVLMMDDDIAGFPKGWDEHLASVLVCHQNVEMVSARLMTPDGKPGLMLNIPYDDGHPLYTVPQQQLPTACIALRNDGTRFDEMYAGSGFEDNDFCHQIVRKKPEAVFCIHNEVKVIHKNEMKNQGAAWEANQAYYRKKWSKLRAA